MAQSSRLERSCQQQEDLVLNEPLDADMHEVITFLHPNQKKAECLSAEDWLSWIVGASDLFLWKGGPLKYAPVFKLPHSGVFIQASSCFLTTFTCYRLESIGRHPIGSAFAESSMHGAEEELFAAVPIHRADFRAFADEGTPIPRKDQNKGPFIPEEEDLALGDYKRWAGMIFLCASNGGYSIQNPRDGRIQAISSNVSNALIIVADEEAEREVEVENKEEWGFPAFGEEDSEEDEEVDQEQELINDTLLEGIEQDDYTTILQAIDAGADLRVGLIPSVGTGNLRLTKYLVEQGEADPEIIAWSLEHAENIGQEEIATYLREALRQREVLPQEPEAKDQEEKASMGDMSNISRRRPRRSSSEEENPNELLKRGIREEDDDEIARAFDGGADMNSGLLFAAGRGASMRVVKYLVELGANNYRDALHAAESNDNNDLADYFRGQLNITRRRRRR